jgi:hypothetical protein
MTIHSVELFRQNEAHKARQARLWGKPKVPAPVLTVIESRKPVDASYHMVLYRAHQARLRETFTMGASFTVNPTAEYCPYRSEIVFEIDDQPMPRPTMKQIAMEVLKDFPGVTLDDLKGPRRNLMFVIPRHRAMYEIMKQRPDFSYPAVGRFFGRDHTVVLWAVAKIKAEMGDGASIVRVERKKERTDNYKRKAKQQSGE